MMMNPEDQDRITGCAHTEQHRQSGSKGLGSFRNCAEVQNANNPRKGVHERVVAWRHKQNDRMKMAVWHFQMISYEGRTNYQ